MDDPTCFDGINANILDACVDLLPDEGRRRVVDIVHALRILSRESSRRGHRIASVSRNHFLVGLEATREQRVRESAVAPHALNRLELLRHCLTYAPPELSEPAITRIRLPFMALDFVVLSRVMLGKGCFLLHWMGKVGGTPPSQRAEAKRERHRLPSSTTATTNSNIVHATRRYPLQPRVCHFPFRFAPVGLHLS